MTVELDESGRVSSVRKSATGRNPQNIEELRAQFRTMRVHWQVTTLKYHEHHFLIDYQDGGTST